MKLSEAIRLGSMLKPQAFGSYRADGGTCAMGAAIDAIGGLVAGKSDEVWPIVAQGPAVCPECADVIHRHHHPYNPYVVVCNPTGAMIIHLNDDHRWTRERIADWVQTIEDAHPAPAQEPETAPSVDAVDPVAAA